MDALTRRLTLVGRGSPRQGGPRTAQDTPWDDRDNGTVLAEALICEDGAQYRKPEELDDRLVQLAYQELGLAGDIVLESVRRAFAVMLEDDPRDRRPERYLRLISQLIARGVHTVGDHPVRARRAG